VKKAGLDKAGDTGKDKDEGMNEDGDEDDDENDDDEEDDAPLHKKPSMKRPAAALSAAMKRVRLGHSTDVPKATAKEPVAKHTPKYRMPALFKPKYDIEDSRSNVQCRTGLRACQNGDVVAPCFKYKNFANGRAGAINAAKKWLADFKKRHKCA
jgi:hypothetical protein